jgi:hypothetical protein
VGLPPPALIAPAPEVAPVLLKPAEPVPARAPVAEPPLMPVALPPPASVPDSLPRPMLDSPPHAASVPSKNGKAERNRLYDFIETLSFQAAIAGGPIAQYSFLQ